MGRAGAWEPGLLGTSPSSATDLLCGLGQAASPLGFHTIGEGLQITLCLGARGFGKLSDPGMGSAECCVCDPALWGLGLEPCVLVPVLLVSPCCCPGCV